MAPVPTATWVKMAVAGLGMCIGGPALIYYVSPSEEELFLRYNPELQRRSLEARKERQEDFDAFVNRLKQYSKSDKPIWTEWELDGQKRHEGGVQKMLADRRAETEAAEQRKAEIRAASSRE
ncbi:CBP4-domain-containing protein [Myriangium duriaei CBS 260.36]|uniref:Cytochrome b mRNA-processing protein 4 n=1 Tax=Myriangium duriaei CBS 260.36 TaxID=1168546 RepID=A0A9P4MJV3_9PEZI|nr:CBP4-domain-containing protein [Myriangium duriaei CBS 260.36]